MGDLESSSGGTVPHIIGHPGAQMNDIGVPDANFADHMEKRLVVAKLTPLLKLMTQGDQNIYNGIPSWGEYKADLKAAGATAPTEHQYLLVAMSVLNSVSESYENSYGDSELLPSGGGELIGSKAAELMRLSGARGTEDLEKILNSHANKEGALNKMLGFGGKLAGAYNGGANAIAKALVEAGAENNNSSLANMGKTFHNLATHPWSKIGWPQMWKNCSFTSTFTLTTRLYCYNAVNEQEYKDQIYAPLAALKLFVTPRSEDGALYTDPWMLELDIPGMIHMPIAYMSNMSVILGGDEKDFSETGRPNVVDVTMTINNVYGVCVNSRIQKDQRPSVKNTMTNGIGSARNYKDKSVWKSGGSGSNSQQEIDQETEQQNDNKYNLQPQNFMQGRRSKTTRQETAASALMKLSGTSSVAELEKRINKN